ncbi:cytochrome p450 [Sesbania bispinosa]|nr:cytochrome p450 [Sesbania bispinosa]
MNSYVTGGAQVSMEDMKVADLLDANTGQWRFHLLRTLLPTEDVENIIRINVPSTEGMNESGRESRGQLLKPLTMHVRSCRIGKANKRRGDFIGSSVLSQPLCWFPPQPGRVKCNVDATLFQHHNSFGIGICVREEGGCFLKAKKQSTIGTSINKKQSDRFAKYSELAKRVRNAGSGRRARLQSGGGDAVKGDKEFINELGPIPIHAKPD